MKLILTHASALEYWRRASTLRRPRPQPSRIRTPSGPLPKAQAAQDLLSRAGIEATSPFHLLVDATEKRSRTQGIVCHSWKGALPHGSLVQIGDGIFVVSPELCFLNEGSTPRIVDNILVGYALCSSYAASGPDRFGHSPITSVAKIQAYLDRAEGMRGVKQARRALRHVQAGSASPMETALSMSFDLPYRWGGYSLSSPALNFEIVPSRRSRKTVSQTYFKCDLYWEKAKLAVEYDSRLYHSGALHIAKDSKRRNELSSLGITVITVTSDQFFSLLKLNKTAHTVARHLGERIQPRDERFASRQIELRKTLFESLKD